MTEINLEWKSTCLIKYYLDKYSEFLATGVDIEIDGSRPWDITSL